MKPKLYIDEHGNKVWKLPNGDRHKEDGPSYIDIFGNKLWYINNKLHRENNPAVETCSGGKEWYLNGIQYTKKEYKKKMRLIKLKHILD